MHFVEAWTFSPGQDEVQTAADLASVLGTMPLRVTRQPLSSPLLHFQSALPLVDRSVGKSSLPGEGTFVSWRGKPLATMPFLGYGCCICPLTSVLVMRHQETTWWIPWGPHVFFALSCQSRAFLLMATGKPSASWSLFSLPNGLTA